MIGAAADRRMSETHEMVLEGTSTQLVVRHGGEGGGDIYIYIYIYIYIQYKHGRKE